jgi:hypothetical protein
MTSKITRRLLAAGTALTLALPGAAIAHSGGHGHGVRSAPCHAIRTGHGTGTLTASQIQALTQACATRDAAVKAANDAYLAATQPALAGFRTTTTPVVAALRTAAQTRRAACAPDRHAQACKDARAAYRTTAKPLFAQLRAAVRTYRQSTATARRTRSAALRSAQRAFRATVAQVLAS